MTLARCSLLLVLFLGQPVGAFARSNVTSEIDRYCTLVRSEMNSSSPFVFSGPDPWTQLDEAPGDMPDQALAFVYTAGPAVRWVFLRILDDQGEWSEDIQYYFRENGTIAKRVRTLDSVPANMELEIATYYNGLEIVKEVTHHHSLRHGRQNSSNLSDPDAPVYLTVDDLPFPEIPDLWRRLS